MFLQDLLLFYRQGISKIVDRGIRTASGTVSRSFVSMTKVMIFTRMLNRTIRIESIVAARSGSKTRRLRYIFICMLFLLGY